MSEDKTVQHGMTDEQQEVFCDLVKGRDKGSRYQLETVKITASREIGQNLRDVFSKGIFDLLDEHGLVEKAARLALGLRFMTNGIGFKVSNPESIGGKGDFVPSEYHEHLIVYYRDWSKQAIRRYGYKDFDATVEIIARGGTIEGTAANIKVGHGTMKKILVECLNVKV